MVLHTCHQLTIKASNVGGLQLFLIVIYGSNWFSERAQLWSELEYINKSSISGPWVVLGDFNFARYTNEKIGGKSLSFAKLSPFNNHLNSCQTNRFEAHWL